MRAHSYQTATIASPAYSLFPSGRTCAFRTRHERIVPTCSGEWLRHRPPCQTPATSRARPCATRLEHHGRPVMCHHALVWTRTPVWTGPRSCRETNTADVQKTPIDCSITADFLVKQILYRQLQHQHQQPPGRPPAMPFRSNPIPYFLSLLASGLYSYYACILHRMHYIRTTHTTALRPRVRTASCPCLALNAL